MSVAADLDGSVVVEGVEQVVALGKRHVVPANTKSPCTRHLEIQQDRFCTAFEPVDPVEFEDAAERALTESGRKHPAHLHVVLVGFGRDAREALEAAALLHREYEYHVRVFLQQTIENNKLRAVVNVLANAAVTHSKCTVESRFVGRRRGPNTLRLRQRHILVVVALD